MPKNRELKRVLKDFELVEELGSGMQRILDVYDRSVFEITPSFIIITFPYASDFERNMNGDANKNERSFERSREERKNSFYICTGCINGVWITKSLPPRNDVQLSVSCE